MRLLAIALTMGISSICVAKTEQQRAYEKMDSLAVEAGTDKSSQFHHYTKVYAKYFEPFRKKKIKFLEIGIFHGESVKLWEAYFQNAELHFVDIDPDMPRYRSERSLYHFADQADVDAMKALAQKIGGNFDIIIDDGGHRMDQQINSFHALFPALKSGGFYIIEDLHTSYWKEYGAHEQKSCVEFLKGLVDELNFSAKATGCADSGKTPAHLKATLQYYQSSIAAIHFYQSLCIIEKK